jgi:hypothetical protein
LVRTLLSHHRNDVSDLEISNLTHLASVRPVTVPAVSAHFQNLLSVRSLKIPAVVKDALPRSAHRSSTPARRPIVFLECQTGIDEAKNSAGTNHAMHEIFAPSNPFMDAT